MHDQEILPCLACGRLESDRFDHCAVCEVSVQAAKLASGCSWKDLSIDGLAATCELYVQMLRCVAFLARAPRTR